MPSLVPLRVPGGWAVVHNAFADEDAVIRDGTITNAAHYGEDLLSVERMRLTAQGWAVDAEGHVLDLGWLPAGDPNGSYVLTLLRGGWDAVVFTLRSKDRQAIRHAAEHAMELVTQEVSDAEIARLCGGEPGTAG